MSKEVVKTKIKMLNEEFVARLQKNRDMKFFYLGDKVCRILLNINNETFYIFLNHIPRHPQGCIKDLLATYLEIKMEQIEGISKINKSLVSKGNLEEYMC